MAKGCVATLTEFSVIVVAFKLVNPVIAPADVILTISCKIRLVLSVVKTLLSKICTAPEVILDNPVIVVAKAKVTVSCAETVAVI